jgi:HrpA-like RNA helicase
MIDDLIRYIDENMKPGAILVFMPGMMEIQQLYDQLSFGKKTNKFVILPLHSTLSSKEQHKVFERPQQVFIYLFEQ